MFYTGNSFHVSDLRNKCALGNNFKRVYGDILYKYVICNSTKAGREWSNTVAKFLQNVEIKMVLILTKLL